MTRAILPALFLAAAVLAACGGGGDDDSERVLHLTTGNYTESELRARVRADGLSEATCTSLKGLDAHDVLDILNVSTPEGTPVQTPDPDDDLRQAEIILEECDRIYG